MSEGPPKFDSLPDGVEWDRYDTEVPGRPPIWFPKVKVMPKDVVEYILGELKKDLDMLEKIERINQN